MSPDLENLAISALSGHQAGLLGAAKQYAPTPPASAKPTPLSEQLELTINQMIDVASETLSAQENTFGRLFGYRPVADSATATPDPPNFADRINIKLQQLSAILREVQQGAYELSNRL